MSELSEEKPSLEDLLKVQLITQMRILDTNYAILRHLDPSLAQKINDLHEKFEYLAPLPFVEE